MNFCQLLRRFSSPRTKLLAARCECLHLIKMNCLALWLDESAHASLAASCEDLRARTGNPPLEWNFTSTAWDKVFNSQPCHNVLVISFNVWQNMIIFSIEFEKHDYESKFFREKHDLNKNWIVPYPTELYKLQVALQGLNIIAERIISIWVKIFSNTVLLFWDFSDFTVWPRYLG
jgi:hypothetical protein